MHRVEIKNENYSYVHNNYTSIPKRVLPLHNLFIILSFPILSYFQLFPSKKFLFYITVFQNIFLNSFGRFTDRDFSSDSRNGTRLCSDGNNFPR